METNEKLKKMGAANNGFLHLVLNLAMVALAIWLCAVAGAEGLAAAGVAGGVMWVVWGFHLPGFMVMEKS